MERASFFEGFQDNFTNLQTACLWQNWPYKFAEVLGGKLTKN